MGVLAITSQVYVFLDTVSSSIKTSEMLIIKQRIGEWAVRFAPEETQIDHVQESTFISQPVSTDPETAIYQMDAVAANIAPNTEGNGTPLLESTSSSIRTPITSAKSRASAKDGSNAYTTRADYPRALSNATTLTGSSLRAGLGLPSNADFQRMVDDEYQFIAQIQGQQDRRAFERDQVEEEDRKFGLNSEDQNSESENQSAPKDQMEEYEALLSKAKQEIKEQTKTYEFLLTKAEQDAKIALEERQDEHDDEVKDLKKELEDASKELKVVTKDLKDATSRNVVIERRLRKASREQAAREEANKAVTEKCKVQEDDIAHKDEQIVRLLSTLKSRQQELEAVTEQYRVASVEARDKARALEGNGLMIPNLQRTIQILIGQLTNPGQYQQSLNAAHTNNLRDENTRLHGVLSELQRRLDKAEAENCTLVQELSRAKRDHDRWTDNQFYGFPEDVFSNPTKIANHLAYNDKLYVDLEKRFQNCSTMFDTEQRKAADDREKAGKSLTALKEEVGELKEVTEKLKKDKKAYRKENGRILRTVLGRMPQDEFHEALNFHFDLVRTDNSVLAARVVELDEEVANLKKEVEGHGQEKENLAKERQAQQEAVGQLEEANKAVVSELDALKYTYEVAEECHKEEVYKYQTALTNVSSELRENHHIFGELARHSASERVQYELDSKNEQIQDLRLQLAEGKQAWIQACNDRDHYYRVTEMDTSVAALHERDVSFLQEQLRLSEVKYAELSSNLDYNHHMKLRQMREYKEAYEAEKARVEELEKQLHELYQNLQGEGSHPVPTTPTQASFSQRADDQKEAVKDLTAHLWKRMLGLEDTLKALGKSIVKPKDKREELRLACERILGLYEDWEDGFPRGGSSVEDDRRGAGSESVDGENADNHDKMEDGGADGGEEDHDQEVQQEDGQTSSPRVVNGAYDQLGYAQNNPRLVIEDSKAEEDIAELGASTEAVLAEEDKRDELDHQEGGEGGLVVEEIEQSSTDEDANSTTPSDEDEATNGSDEDDRTITQANFNAVAVTTPQHAAAESTGGAVGRSPPDEGDPDDSLDMSPATWARRYAPPFLYEKPVEDDMF